MINIGDIIEVKIENLSSSGKGVGYYNDDTKRSIFVEYSVPGDILKVKINKLNKVYYEAEIVEILKKSKDRIDSPCPYFMECGGCDWLNIPYNIQIQEKENLLRFFLSKHNFNNIDIEVIEAISPFNYRDKVRITNNGLFRRNSNEIIKIDYCKTINEEINKVAFSKKENENLTKFYGFDYENNKVSSKLSTYFYKNIKLRYHPKGFVQSNLKMNELMTEKILSLVKGDDVLDLYSGNGNFAIPLASKVKRIIAVEGSKLGYSLLMDNIKLNNIKNIKTYNKDVFNYVKTLNKKFNTIILDPPRSGSKDILEELYGDNIIYVSCNANQALKEIKKNKSYALKQAILIDLFPQTKHFECIFVMTRK